MSSKYIAGCQMVRREVSAHGKVAIWVHQDGAEKSPQVGLWRTGSGGSGSMAGQHQSITGWS